jgi:LEA14-like dessication related protein
MGKLKALLLPLLCLFLLSSCSPWEEVQVQDPRLEELNWSSEKNEDGGPRKLDVVILATVKNPNRTTFRIVGTDLDLYLDEKGVGEAELTETVKIPGGSEEEQRFQVEAELKDLASGGLKALGSVLGGTAPELRIKGHIKARAYGILSKEFPIDESRRINISDLMGHSIGSRSSITFTPKSPFAVR